MTIVDEFRSFLISKKAEDIDKKVKQFEEYVNGKLKSKVVYDELVDFIDLKMKRPTRWKSFARYIETRYDSNIYNKVLDVGSGIKPELSIELKNKGYDVTAMDPKIEEVSGITCIKALFDYEKTSVLEYDLLVGLEPCMAAEHIVRSAISNNKPFVVSLCAAAHDSISGKKFKDMNEWWDYLVEVSNGKAYIENKIILGKEHAIIRNK